MLIWMLIRWHHNFIIVHVKEFIHTRGMHELCSEVANILQKRFLESEVTIEVAEMARFAWLVVVRTDQMHRWNKVSTDSLRFK